MSSRTWISNAVRIIEADFNRSADTHLIPLPLPALPGVQVYLKDESSHPPGSLRRSTSEFFPKGPLVQFPP